MKTTRLAILITLLFQFFLLQAQNLVPNPSFEEYSDCPTGYPDLDGKLNDWMSFRGTPDYINNCSSLCGYNNSWGYQEPHSGEGYISLIPYSVSGSNPPLLREHLGVQLISPLIIGTKYFVSFYASAAWEPIGMTIAVNKTGVLFTTYAYSASSVQPLDNHCHVWTEDIVADTVNWVKISGSFIADSAYTYLVVGNFFEDAYTDTINLPTSIGFNQRAMVYIDDICVSTDSLYAHNWTGIRDISNQKNDFIIYPNPATQTIMIQTENVQSSIKGVMMFDVTGKAVHGSTSLTMTNAKVDVSDLSNGLYFLHIAMSNGQRVVRKVVKE